MAPSGAAAEEIDDLENVITTSASTIGKDHEHMTNVTVVGVQLESVHTCIGCKAELTASKTVTMCTDCNTWYHSAISLVSKAIIPLAHAHYKVGGMHNDSGVRNDSVIHMI